jgi:hypothetical protein
MNAKSKGRTKRCWSTAGAAESFMVSVSVCAPAVPELDRSADSTGHTSGWARACSLRLAKSVQRRICFRGRRIPCRGLQSTSASVPRGCHTTSQRSQAAEQIGCRQRLLWSWSCSSFKLNSPGLGQLR